MKWTPHPYQRRMVRWILERPAAGLFAKPGSGKTSVVLRAFRTLHDQGIADRMLVLAPLSVAHAVWPEQVARWDFCAGMRVEVLHGPRKDEALRRPAEIQVVNYEGLPWLAKQRGFRWPKILVMDESTKLKHHGTKRFRTLREHLSRFDRRIALTGTPAPNGLMDLFGQLYCLDLGRRLHPYITRFRGEFFSEIAPHEYLPHPDAEERIRDRIGDICCYVDPNEYLQLPPLVETRVSVLLPAKAQRAYASLEATFVAELEEGEVTAANAAVLSGKLRQVAGGAVYGDGGDWHEIHDAKVEALLDRVEEGGEPCVVAYAFDHERERLAAAFEREGWAWAHLAGSPRKRTEAVRAWNAGELDVLMGHPEAIGRGLNLQDGGRRLIWFAPTWNLEHHEQTVDRLWRQGQTKRTFVDVLVAEGTVEEAVLGALAAKDRTQRGLLEHLRAWGRKRRGAE